VEAQKCEPSEDFCASTADDLSHRRQTISKSCREALRRPFVEEIPRGRISFVIIPGGTVVIQWSFSVTHGTETFPSHFVRSVLF
jgi:hypothetical protein